MSDDYDAAADSLGSYNLAIQHKRKKFLAEKSGAKRVEIIGNCTLYLGDCLDVLPYLGTFDALVTDPPYGINITKSNRLAVSRGMGGKTWDDKPIDDEAISLIRSKAAKQIIWGGNYFQLPPTRAPLVWDKNNAGRDFADFEMAWTNLDMVARRFIFRPMNMDGGKQHPTQKPIQVMQWCISYLEGTKTILDPFLGSGTTLVACARLGLQGTGIERDEAYFDIACERVTAAYAEPSMFVEAERIAEQVGFDL